MTTIIDHWRSREETRRAEEEAKKAEEGGHGSESDSGSDSGSDVEGERESARDDKEGLSCFAGRSDRVGCTGRRLPTSSGLLTNNVLLCLSSRHCSIRQDPQPSGKESPESQSESPDDPTRFPHPRGTRSGSTAGVTLPLWICRRRCCSGCRGCYIGGERGQGGDTEEEGRGEGSKRTESFDRCGHSRGSQEEEKVEAVQGDW